MTACDRAARRSWSTGSVNQSRARPIARRTGLILTAAGYALTPPRLRPAATAHLIDEGEPPLIHAAA